MSAHRTARHGDGTVWLVVDRLIGDYLCYWYAGTNDGHLVDHTRLATASDAVAWGRLRTSRVRIRTADACTRWAGTAPRPAGFTHTWTDPDPTTVPQPSSVHDAGPAFAPTTDEPHDRGRASPSPGHDQPTLAPNARETAGMGHAVSGSSPC